MNPLDQKVLLVSALASLIMAASGLADERDDLLPPRAKPTAERAIGIQPWEEISTAPWGHQRMGGWDRRYFIISPDGKWLATEDPGGWQLELWDLEKGTSLGRFGRIKDPVALAFSPDGRWIVSAEQSPHDVCSVKLWDVAGRKLARSLDEDVNTTPFTAVAFSPDGKTLALGGGALGGARGFGAKPDFGLQLWDVESGEPVRRFAGPALPAEPTRPGLQPNFFECLAYSPDGRSLALVADQQVWVWEVASGKERCQLGALPPFFKPKERFFGSRSCVAFSPDGRLLAVGCPDGAVRLWEVNGGRELPTLGAHRGAVRAVGFVPGGNTLISVGRDNRVLTWPTAGPFRDWLPRRGGLPERALEALGDDLSSDDPVMRYAAVRNLAAAPAQALAFLRTRLRPVPVVDPQRITQLVADLEKDDLGDRKRAAGELRRLGDLALPALRQAEQRSHGMVLRRLLEMLEDESPSREQVQTIRTLEVLERIATEDAGRLLGTLAQGAPEALLTQQAKRVRERLAQSAAFTASNISLETAWDNLTAEDARRAYQAMRTLVAAPERSIPFLRDRLRPVAAAEAEDDDPKRIARLIADLDSDDFATRNQAAKELARLGTLAGPALRKAVPTTPSVEVKRRLEELLKDLGSPVLSSERLRAGRALEVLELVGNDEARQALEALRQ
jgi:WD40 repeat protein